MGNVNEKCTDLVGVEMEVFHAWEMDRRVQGT